LPPSAFVNFLQNHDQIGNRAMGERLSVLAKPQALDAAMTILLLSPAIPLLYMGEEWGATDPFPFFCDFEGDLANAVREGRKAEFAEAYAAPHLDLPDPLSDTTLDLAKLNWEALKQQVHADRLSQTRELLRLRKAHIVPLLSDMTGRGDAHFDDAILRVTWRAGAKDLHLLANLSDRDQPRPDNLPLWTEAVSGGEPPLRLPPWSVFVGIGEH
jgi:maltooligosyltrehalose trehalohydrolase